MDGSERYKLYPPVGCLGAGGGEGLVGAALNSMLLCMVPVPIEPLLESLGELSTTGDGMSTSEHSLSSPDPLNLTENLVLLRCDEKERQRTKC